MGNYLPSPNSEKTRTCHTIGDMRYASCEMQGWRCAMEDEHVFHYFDHLDVVGGPLVLCGVYDGHGGRHVATFVARHLVEELFRDSDFRKGRFDTAFRSTYLALDRLLTGPASQAELMHHTRAAAIKQSTSKTAAVAESPGAEPLLASDARSTLTNGASSAPAMPGASTVDDASIGDVTPSEATSGGNTINAVEATEEQQKLPRLLWEGKAIVTREEAAAELAKFDPPEQLLDRNPRRSRHGNGSSKRHRRKKSMQPLTFAEGAPSEEAVSSEVLSAEAAESGGGSSRLVRWRRNATSRGNRRVENAFPDDSSRQSLPLPPSAVDISGTTQKSNVPEWPANPTDPPSASSSGGFRGFITGLFRRSNTGNQGTCMDHIPANHLALHAGCTAVTVLLTKTKIHVANAGDSRCVLCRGDTAVDLTKDHKPQNPAEKARIYAAGGWVEMGRVNGNLNLSRAIGDLFFKMSRALPPERQVVTCIPDVTTVDIQEQDEFLLIGCDGIWEASTSQEIIDFVKQRIDKRSTLGDILDELLDELLSPNPTLFEFGCDNMTVCLIDLRAKQRSKEDLSQSAAVQAEAPLPLGTRHYRGHPRVDGLDNSGSNRAVRGMKTPAVYHNGNNIATAAAVAAAAAAAHSHHTAGDRLRCLLPNIPRTRSSTTEKEDRFADDQSATTSARSWRRRNRRVSPYRPRSEDNLAMTKSSGSGECWSSLLDSSEALDKPRMMLSPDSCISAASTASDHAKMDCGPRTDM